MLLAAVMKQISDLVARQAGSRCSYETHKTANECPISYVYLGSRDERKHVGTRNICKHVRAHVTHAMSNFFNFTFLHKTVRFGDIRMELGWQSQEDCVMSRCHVAFGRPCGWSAAASAESALSSAITRTYFFNLIKINPIEYLWSTGNMECDIHTYIVLFLCAKACSWNRKNYDVCT